MNKAHEIKVNARGLSTPGPRMMIETALSGNPPNMVRVVVSSQDAVGDVEACLRERGANRVVVDTVGDEFHVRADFQG